jgi:hypothetical protein
LDLLDVGSDDFAVAVLVGANAQVVDVDGANYVLASKFGVLEGNSFLNLIEGQEQLSALGELVLWKGAQDILFEELI